MTNKMNIGAFSRLTPQDFIKFVVVPLQEGFLGHKINRNRNDAIS